MLGLRTGTGTTVSKENVSREGLANLYFPLQTGNIWIYEFEAGNQTLQQRVEVTGTQESRGFDWYILEYSIQGQQTVFSKLLRTDQDHLYLYNPSRLEESMLIDFGREEPDENNLPLGFVEEDDVSVVIHNRTYTNCCIITTGFVDNEVATYAPGIGLIESSWFRGRKQLRSATVGGVEIV